MNQIEDRQSEGIRGADSIQTGLTRNICRFDRHLFIFLFFTGLFSWPMLTILEGTSNLFDFLYLFIIWLGLILLLFRIRKSSLKCLETTTGEDR